MTRQSSKFNFRLVDVNDGEILLKWRNDPVTRAMSFNTEIVSRENHYEWLQRSLQNPNRKLLIGLMEDVPVGTVRFDETPDKSYVEISVTLAPEVRGRGLSSSFIQSSCDYYLGFLDRRIPIKAKIKPENIKSVKAFESAGFKFIDKTEDRLNYLLRDWVE